MAVRMRDEEAVAEIRSGMQEALAATERVRVRLKGL